MMRNVILGRRRMLAGLVALGALGPSALAQRPRPPSCSTTLNSNNASIRKASGTIGEYAPGAAKDPNAKYFSELRAEFLPTQTISDDPSGIRGYSARLAFSSTSRDVPDSVDFWLSDLESGRISGLFKGSVRIKFADADFEPQYEEGERFRGTAKWKLPKGSDLFGKLTGPLRVDVFAPGSSATSRPASTFLFSAQTLNEGWNLANEALRQSNASQRARACEPSIATCFLTTAAVETIGLEDNCWELTALRDLRDNWLVHQAGGAADVERYYKHAPAIAEKLKREPKRLLRLYFTGLLPSAIAAKLSLNRTARAIYSWHMRRLMAAQL